MKRIVEGDGASVARLLGLITVLAVSVGSLAQADVMCLSPSGGITIRPENVCRSNEIQVDPAAVSATVAHEMEQIAALQTQTAALEQQTAEQAAQITVLQGDKAELQAQVATLETETAQQATALKDVEEKVSKSTPAGTILDFGGSTAPEGYLLCNGEPVSRSEYAELFAVIGTNFGEGDGSTTFNLPDLRGRFTRGVDGGAGHDPEAASRGASGPGGNTGDAVGSYQHDTFSFHSHRYGEFNGIQITAVPGNGIFAIANTPGRSGFIEGSGGAETRPRNVAVHKIIKH